jgi:hypothetical protein
VIVEKLEFDPILLGGSPGVTTPPPPTVTGYVEALTGKAATQAPNGLTV